MTAKNSQDASSNVLPKSPSTTDILIIGAGLVGLCTAIEFAQAGCSVQLLDRTNAGAEASWAGGGILCPLNAWRYPDSVNALAQRSQQQYPQLVAELEQHTGIDVQYRRTGLLVLNGLEDMTRIQRWGQRFGQTLKPLQGAQVQQAELALLNAPEQALELPDVAQIRNPRLLKALVARARQLGVQCHWPVSIEGWRQTATAVTGVDTDHGRFQAKHTVVCAGAWTPTLLQPLGVKLAIQPVRGQMLMFTGPAPTSRIVLHGDDYLIPRADGRWLFGSTQERVGYDKRPTTAGNQQLLAKLKALLGNEISLKLEAQWAGLRPGSPNGVPTIAAVPQRQGLWVNAGHFRNGVLLAPASAKVLADQILERQTSLDVADYQLAQAATVGQLKR